MAQNYNPITNTGRQSASTAATGPNLASTPVFSANVKNLVPQIVQCQDLQMNQNEFSSDILMKVKAGSNNQ